jgi:tetratricopeptide (TPR) repeat protein
LWDAETGQQLGEPLTGHGDDVNSVAFSPDGLLLASASADKTVRLWDLSTEQPRAKPLIGHTSWVNSVAFSPDGQRLASASTDQTLRLWNPNSGKPIGDPLTGHTGSVTCVAFSPDGSRIASGSRDGTVRAWDARNGRPLGPPLTAHPRIRSVAFSPDGQQLASAGNDGAIRLWPGAALAEMLRAKLTANLSRRQWREWVSPHIDYSPPCPDLPMPSDDDSLTPTLELHTDPWVQWEPCAGGQDAAALEQLGRTQPQFFARSELRSSRWSRLSFYEAHRLMELTLVRDHRTQPAFVLVGPQSTVWLNGSSSPIHETNQAESLALSPATVDEPTVIDYIRFFLKFLRGDAGAFVLLESSDQIRSGESRDQIRLGGHVSRRAEDERELLTLEAARGKARPLLMRGHDGEGRWLAAATIAYEGDIFSASLAVTPEGEVTMTDDEPIGALGPLKVQFPALEWEALATPDPDELRLSVEAAEQEVDAHPGDPLFQRALSISLDWLADARLMRREADGALNAYTRSLDIAERLAKAQPDDPGYQHDLAVTLNSLGDVQMAREQADRAVEPFIRSVELFDRLADAHPDNPEYQSDLTAALMDLGEARSQTDDADGALQAYIRSVDISKQLTDAYADNLEYRRKLAAAWCGVGSVKLEAGDSNDALQAFTRCGDMFEQLANAEPDNLRIQRGVAVAAWYTASALESLDDPSADRFWRRAHETFVALDAKGRLVDDDRAPLDELTEKLDPT